MKKNKASFNDLITSSNGIHISIYLPRPSSTLSSKNILDLAITKCENQMKWTVEPEIMKDLIGPIRSLANNPALMSGFNHNVGIFRSQNFLRLISIPVDLEFSVYVADTFHVKPLFSQIQKDFEYIFFGTDGKKGYLYQGTSKAYTLIDEFYFHDDTFLKTNSEYMSIESPSKKRSYLTRYNLHWVEQAISAIDENKEIPIFISANTKETKILRKFLKNRNLYDRNVSRRYKVSDEKSVHQTIQLTIEAENNISENISLSEFKNPAIRRLSNSRISFDLEEISLAAAKGAVKKLIIASDANIFGKWNQITGQIVVQETDMDHTDDDLLDDIAQKVFMSGGEVLVTSKKYMPKGELIAATIRETNFPQSACNDGSVPVGA